MKCTVLAAALAATAFAGATAQAATYNFGGAGGSLGFDEVFSDTTATSTLTAIAINTEQPSAPQLHQNAAGIGVNTGAGDIDQIDNIGDDEAIVFDFGGLVKLESIAFTLISGFPNLGFDQFEIYGSNDAGVAACTTGGLSCLTSISTLLASGFGSGLEGGVNVDLSGVVTAFRYLIATTPGGSGDGYRVGSLSASAVPLPAGLPLMLTALGGMGALRRLRRKSA